VINAIAHSHIEDKNSTFSDKVWHGYWRLRHS
jgi:hypothetical protein